MLSLVVLVVLAAAAAVYFGKLAFNEPGPSDVTTNYVVKSGTGIVEIADGLERRNIISDARVFKYGVQAYGHQGDMKAGEYEIKAHASMREIMDLLRSGKSLLRSLTISEGLTVEHIFQRVVRMKCLLVICRQSCRVKLAFRQYDAFFLAAQRARN